MNQVQSLLEVQEIRYRTDEEYKCHQAFRTSEYEKYKDRNPNRVDGTCKWFLEHPNFHSWHESKKSSLLWVSADPGCGKSVLSKFLVDKELPAIKPRTICYFFFKDDNIDQKSSTKALSALLHQLFSQNNMLVKYAMPEFKHEGPNLPQLFGKQWSILTKAIADPKAGEIVCVLDALDECEKSERFILIDTLKGFYRNIASNGTALKFLVTSRPYFDIERRFKELTSDLPTIRLAGEVETASISREIDIVIKAKVQEIGVELGLEDSVRSSLEEDLLNITHRTYLWLKLIFDVISNQLIVTKKSLWKSVVTIPETVNEAYETILKRSPDPELAKKILHIVVSGVRPLTLKEMNVALAIEDHSRSYEELDLEKESDFQTTIRNACGLFVSISNGEIHLIHQTAKDFLVYNEDADEPSCPGIWKHSLNLRESHLVLAKSCIWYLLFTVFESHALIICHRYGIERVVNSYAENHDFLDYAAKNWADHFRSAKITRNTALLKSTLKICDTRSKRFMTWFQVYWVTVEPYSPCSRNFTDLMVGSYFGHEVVVRLLVEKGAEIDSKDSQSGRTPLSWAAGNGHEAVAQLLLEKGSDVNTEDKGQMTPLHFAAAGGHEAVVKLLLQNRAHIGMKEQSGRTPLAMAIESGSEVVSKLLLAEGSEMNYYYTPTVSASDPSLCLIDG